MTKRLEKTYRSMLTEGEDLDEAKKQVKEQGGINQSDNEEGEKDVKEAKKPKKMKEDGGDAIDDDDEELEEGNEAELNKKLKVGQNKIQDSKTKGKTPKQENDDPESITLKEAEDEDEEEMDDKKDKKENPFAKKDDKKEKLKESLDAQAQEASAEMGSLLEGQDLQEDHKDQVKTLFDVALADRTYMIQESLEEQFETDLNEAIEECENTLVESLDKYLDKVVNEWLEENRLAVESGVKAEITESFLSSMKVVFDDHYVDVPDEKMDIVENVIDENEELEDKLNEEMKLRMEAEEKLTVFRKGAVVETMSEGLTLTEKERLMELSEDVDYADDETFTKKVKTIKENFIKNVPSDNDTEILNEEAPVMKDENLQDPVAQRYMSAMSRLADDKFNMKDNG